jgi:hypothetical protein
MILYIELYMKKTHKGWRRMSNNNGRRVHLSFNSKVEIFLKDVNWIS